MKLDPTRKIQFTLDLESGGKIEFIASIPTVGQIQRVLKLDPVDEEAKAKEAPSVRTMRQFDQALILLSPPEPYQPMDARAQETYQSACENARRVLSALNTRQLAQVFDVLYLGAMGYDLDKLSESLELAAQKKTAKTRERKNAMKSARGLRTG
jgi:hypothetical protein